MKRWTCQGVAENFRGCHLRNPPEIPQKNFTKNWKVLQEECARRENSIKFTMFVFSNNNSGYFTILLKGIIIETHMS